MKPKHGHRISDKRTPEYNSWRAMKARCYSPNNENYAFYGALGVQVCDTWKQSFEAFLKDMGKRPHGKTLDRIDPHGNYQPDNCRWATTRTQSRNKRKKAA